MKTLWILAAAATFAACHNRSDDDMGAAPDRGDSTSTSGYDTTMTAQPQPSTPGYDTTSVVQPTSPSYDTTSATPPVAPPSTEPAAPPTTEPATPSPGYDTTTTPNTGYDTTSTAVPPAADPGADTTMSPNSTDTEMNPAPSAGTPDVPQSDSGMTNSTTPDSATTPQ